MNPTRRQHLLAVMILAAGLRLHGAGQAELDAAIRDQLAFLPDPPPSDTDLRDIASSLASLPPRHVTHLLDSLIAAHPPNSLSQDWAAQGRLRRQRAGVRVGRGQGIGPSSPLPAQGRQGSPEAATAPGGEVSSPSVPSSQSSVLSFHTAAGIDAATPASTDWIAEPWAAPGAITAITGRPKIGKTTFVLDLVAAVLTGAPFLGYPTASSCNLPSPLEGEGPGMRASNLPSPLEGEGPGMRGDRTPVVYLTEQQPASFRASLARAGLLGEADLTVLFWHQAMILDWHRVLALVARQCRALGARLLVVDTLSQWAGLRGDMENQAGDAFAALQPLQQIAATGVAVVFIQHERKIGGDAAEAGRGSSAFAGAVDTLVSFRRPPHLTSSPRTLNLSKEGNGAPVRSERRLLLALSRFESVPPELYIERIDGRYAVIGDTSDFATRHARAAILATLSAVPPSLEGKGDRGLGLVSPSLEGKGPGDRSVSPRTGLAGGGDGVRGRGHAAGGLTLEALIQATGIRRMAARAAIDELLAAGHVSRMGAGKRADPYRYQATNSFLVPIE